MKTYKEFKQDLYEFRKALSTANQFLKSKKPFAKGLTGLSRAEYIKQAVTGKTPLDKAAGVAGVVRPLSLFPLAAPTIFRQGKSGSSTDSAMKDIHDLTKKVTKGRIQTNPETDLGKRIGDKIGNKLNKVFQRRNQNRGANELKGSTSGMG